ncbi:MAG: queuosine precursor transporter, partial [Planctomycetota bacterium]
ELPGFLPNDAGGGFPVRPEFNPDKGLYEETGWTFYQIRFLAISSVFASMVAYLAAQFIDVQVFHFWKRLTKGKHLWLRNNGSTIISQFVDTFAVITITHFYASALPIDDAKAIWPQLWLFIATGFAFKLIAALVDTPIIYLAVAVLRKYLHLDPTTEHNADAEEIQMFSRPEQG